MGEAKVSGLTVYMGRAVEPNVAVTVGGKTLVAGTDYVVTHSDNEGLGAAKATVTGKGNYTGVLVVCYEITSEVSAVFSDAPTDQWYMESGALDFAYAHGLISGHFRPYSQFNLLGALYSEGAFCNLPRVLFWLSC